MNLSKYLDKKRILLDMQSADKDSALNELFALLKESGKLSNAELFFKDVLEREKLMTTGIGHSVAIPHARSEYVDDFVVVCGISRTGIDFESLDGVPVKLFFLMGSPAGDGMGRYLQFLAHLNRLLQKETFREALVSAPDEDSFIKMFRAEEKVK